MPQEDPNEQDIVPDPKPFKCPYCPKAFPKNFSINRHVREVHDNTDRKTIKHIREEGKVLCPICKADFTHTASLKKHIIRVHEVDEIEEKNIDVELVVGQPLKKQKPDSMKTSLEEIKDA